MRDLRVLVVDDSKVGRVTMLKKLEPLGVQVDTVESGQQALDYLEQTRPDAIFMDHMMPDMDGFEVTRRIKAAPATRDIPVIVVSGNDEAEFIEDARAAGAIDAIAKPPAPGVLEALLDALPARVAPAKPVVSAPGVPEPAEAAKPAQPDLAEVDARIARQLARAVDDLRGELATDIRNQAETEFTSQRHALDEWHARWRGQLAPIAEEMAELKRGTAEFAALDKRLNDLAQRLDQAERAVPPPAPDQESLLASLDKPIASRLEAFRHALEAQFQQRTPPPLADAERESLLASLRAQIEALRMESGEASANLLARHEADMARVDATLAAHQQGLAARDEHLNRLLQLEQRLDAVEAAQRDAATRPALEQAVTWIEDEISNLHERTDESRLRKLIADTQGTLERGAETAPESGASQASADMARLDATVDQLNRKVKTLTALLAGGALLLAALAALVLTG